MLHGKAASFSLIQITPIQELGDGVFAKSNRPAIDTIWVLFYLHEPGVDFNG